MSKANRMMVEKKKLSTFWVVELGVIDAVPQSPFVSLSVVLAPPSNFFSLYTSQKTQQHFSRPLFLLHGNATYRAFKHRIRES